MDHRSEDTEIVRSVGSPSVDEEIFEKNASLVSDGDAEGDVGGNGETDEGVEGDILVGENGEDDADLPQCKIKRNYSCNLCPFFSQNPRSFLYHSRDVHFDRIKIYECSQCLYASKHSQKLQRHINMIHVPGKTRKIRNKMIRPDRKELRPIRPKPPDLYSESPVKIFTLLTDEQKLKVDTEHSDEPEKTPSGEFKCSACNFKHRNPKLLRRHEKLVHLKKRYLKCNKCSYVTHVTARFTKHVKYHSMPMIKCDLCDFRTPYKWNLDRHYKNHSGSGAFQCAKCNFRADIKQSLTVHEMNHHVPPVGQGAAMARKKNKVGGSESQGLDCDGIDKEGEMSGLEKEDSEAGGPEETESMEEQQIEKLTNLQNLRNVKPPYSSKRESANNNHLQTDFIHPDDIVPRYGQIFVKNLKCKFCSYKAVFSHEIWRHEKRIHGYVRPENKKEAPSKRPPPQLIPIQNKTSSSAILKIPSVKNKSEDPSPEATPVEKPVNDIEFNEMCKKSSLTSSLKVFVSLIGDEEGLKTIPDSSREDLEAECSGWVSEPAGNSENKNDDLGKQKQTDLLKKKNASFFDKLKEKLLTGNNEEQSLFCEICGHESKCLSEAVAHQKRHSNASFKEDCDGHAESDIVLSGAELSSTRCQHCRQRCKTSTDLINHLKSCKAFEASLDFQCNSDDKADENSLESEGELKIVEDEPSMENRVFVWNDLSQSQKEEDELEDMDIDAFLKKKPLRTSPGYGTVTSKGSDNTESGTLVMRADPRLHVSVKKVFKCPHCSFWASTASRFHVHIVGHLNKKPFECSLCLYRSNWRWDITKHIRLKSLRDPSHFEAKVNMTDETGRRNYSKYNRFLTMMRVQEPTAESSGYGRRSRNGDMTHGSAVDKDIIPIPAPPKLTRAPLPNPSSQPPQEGPLRPPPPLKAAHPVSSQSDTSKEAKEAKEAKESKESKESKDPVKKSYWKCKKCNFRDVQKGRVLLHVKKHYISKKRSKGSRGNPSNPNDVNNPTTGSDQPDPASELRALLKSPSYSCGHCHQVSNWKHVIQRHCKLKHNGDSLIEINWKDEIQSSNYVEENYDEPVEVPVKPISCDICPFTTDTEGDLTAHKLNHVDRPGSIFKCTYCPFYVPSKIAVLEHMEVHGVLEGSDLTSLKVDNFDPKEELIAQKSGTTGDTAKKYKCLQCPYISNSRTQFLYHKQFHRPRNSPFKCLYCTYNVSRRHLLHQHLRVHHNRDGKIQSEEEQQVTVTEPEKTPEENQPQEPTEKKEEQPTEKKEEPEKDVAGQDMAEIPLVWVVKSGNIQKMFKCRWCPHVNARKINIQEHEKMHQSNENKTPNGGVKLQCTECNYSCNNAGVLATHVKVHQGFYGEIRSVVDPTRPESEQIQELQNNLRLMEPEVVVIEGNPVEAEVEEAKTLFPQPENVYSQTKREETLGGSEKCKKILSFCDKCPARFFCKKEWQIHSKFHMIHLPFRCFYCSYTARQRPHLLAHYKVHGQEYRKKTRALLEVYTISLEHPQPKATIFSRESYLTEGPVWVVKPPKKKQEGKAVAKHACHRCPATFFKPVALQYHLNLHGGSFKHKCKYCDYTVKTHNNLIKHQLVHEKHSKEKRSKKAKFSYSFPISGTDLLQTQEETETRKDEKSEEIKEAGPQYETSSRGSPEFMYSTFIEQDKIKDKKYKCHKCPSAFEKLHQYRVHLTLHGSKQKYRCGKCDYSSKYYANFARHMRKHETRDEALKIKKLDEGSKDAPAESFPKDGSVEDKKPFELTLLEQQTLLLLEKKKSLESKDEDRKTYYCGYCPYSSNRRDAIENHTWRHYLVSGIKSGFECPHCDYSATQNNFLREHIKLHFNSATRYKAEAYLKCEKMELWCCEEDAKDPKQILIFQDKGHEEPDRYFPPVEKYESDQEENDWKAYFSQPALGSYKENEESQKFFEDDDFCQNEELIEMLEEEIEQIQVEKKRRRRCRGKNWRCKKCPHAFGKKDQYLRHVSLHGSNQRHNCDICDYSVKFYTNYVQHMRMHQMHEPDRVIYVKKNFQSLMESAQRLLAASLVEESDFSLNQEERQNPEFECGFESLDDDNSQCNENLVIDETCDEKEEDFLNQENSTAKEA